MSRMLSTRLSAAKWRLSAAARGITPCSAGGSATLDRVTGYGLQLAELPPLGGTLARVTANQYMLRKTSERVRRFGSLNISKAGGAML